MWPAYYYVKANLPPSKLVFEPMKNKSNIFN